ncbi:hypothetical protein F511_31132 [Dorcoceras hygrometricum]|uniref:Uncharacterized protein n=1 Tax=Dorcoceras hygrometricum TaxID=472368 RepID=A0A2Z7C6K7_9LAMI|nr:hypothetical protein F511_31132 [Dorcoceras hygrometricum]
MRSVIASHGPGSNARGSRTSQNPLLMLNTLSSVSARESRIQYLCDPQWFRDTASRGPTTIVAPESQSQTCPTDHGALSDSSFRADSWNFVGAVNATTEERDDVFIGGGCTVSRRVAHYHTLNIPHGHRLLQILWSYV